MAMKDGRMTVGELARRAGVHLETIRYYEQVGVMPPPRRTNAGYRVYDQQDLRRLHFIKRAKQLGFTLKEIRDLLDLRMDPDTTCEDVRQRALQKVETIERKIRELVQMKRALEQLAATCTGEGPAGECPFLDALEAVSDREARHQKDSGD
ncbi:MAG: heavy metal-responsive transcriptional regulator [Calditrichaeota bacterium]|nr:heavy metal-responsive transcriptional regulator [Calditrichota bacterium]